MKDYLEKKDSEKLSISLAEQKLARSLAKAPLSCSSDGLLHFGYKIMLHNHKTNGYLVIDVGDRIPSADEAYAVTTNSKGIGPLTRSVFVVTRVDDKDGFTDNVVHYGQKIRIQSNPYIFPKSVYFPFKTLLALTPKLSRQSSSICKILAEPGNLHAHQAYL